MRQDGAIDGGRAGPTAAQKHDALHEPPEGRAAGDGGKGHRALINDRLPREQHGYLIITLETPWYPAGTAKRWRDRRKVTGRVATAAIHGVSLRAQYIFAKASARIIEQCIQCGVPGGSLRLNDVPVSVRIKHVVSFAFHSLGGLRHIEARNGIKSA